MKNIAGSRNQRTDIRNSAYRLRREWWVEEERFEFRVKLRRRSSQSGAGLIDAGLMRRWLTKLLGKTISGTWCDLSVSNVRVVFDKNLKLFKHISVNVSQNKLKNCSCGLATSVSDENNSQRLKDLIKRYARVFNKKRQDVIDHQLVDVED